MVELDSGRSWLAAVPLTGSASAADSFCCLAERHKDALFRQLHMASLYLAELMASSGISQATGSACKRHSLLAAVRQRVHLTFRVHSRCHIL